MNILLTGASGQVGARLLPLLAADGHRVTAPPRAALDLGDGAALAAAVRGLAPDLVINAAAWTDVEAAESDPAAVEINARAPALLAVETARLGVPLLHFSSDYVFDGRRRGAYGEDAPLNPLNAYGRGKAAGDLAVLAANRRGVILRTGWVYDSRGRNFLRTILGLMSTRDEVKVVADQIGAPTPAAVVAEAARRAVAALAGGASLAPVINVTCRGRTSWHGFACAIEQLARHQGAALAVRTLTPIDSAAYWGTAVRPLNSRLRLERLGHCLGWRPPHWRAALAQLFRDDGAALLPDGGPDGDA